MSEQGVAVKRDPAKWEAAKREATARMGGKHSARAMQLAVQIYKRSGGEYSGRKPAPTQNKLRKWTKQDWQWTGKDHEGQGGEGVYLPARAKSALKSTEGGRAKIERASRIKRDATRRGEQFSQHGLHEGKERSEVKTASKEDKHRKLKIFLAGAGGASLGGASGFALAQAIRRSDGGSAFGDMHGSYRLNYLLPAATALGVGLYGANYMRNKTRDRLEKRAELERALRGD